MSPEDWLALLAGLFVGYIFWLFGPWVALATALCLIYIKEHDG